MGWTHTDENMAPIRHSTTCYAVAHLRAPNNTFGGYALASNSARTHEREGGAVAATGGGAATSIPRLSANRIAAANTSCRQRSQSPNATSPTGDRSSTRTGCRRGRPDL